jgi:hypothetical protein
MRCINQPVQMKRTSQGWMTTRATSKNKNDSNYNRQKVCRSQKLNSVTPGTTMMTMHQCWGHQERKSRSKRGQWWQWRQQWLWQWQTTIEMEGADNNQKNVAVAAVAAETVLVATAIVAAWRQRRRWLWQTTGDDSGRGSNGGIGYSISCDVGGGFCGSSVVAANIKMMEGSRRLWRGGFICFCVWYTHK